MIKVDKYYKRSSHPCFYGTSAEKLLLYTYHSSLEEWIPTNFNKKLVLEAVRDFREISEQEFNSLILVRKLVR